MDTTRDDLAAAYDRISDRFPADWDVTILRQTTVGRRKTLDVNLSRRSFVETVYGVDDTEYSLHVTPKDHAIGFCEIDVDLDDIEAAAERIIDQIAAADMADPVKSRRGLDRLARAMETAGGGTGRAA